MKNLDFIFCADPSYSDVSTSFKRLQAEKLAADSVLRDVSPLEGIKDADALRDFFKEIQVKDKVCSLYMLKLYTHKINHRNPGIPRRDQAFKPKTRT